MSWFEAMLAAFLATLGRPRWWLLALAAFLVRGGVLLLALPILTIPSPADVGRFLGPDLVGIGPGALGPAFVPVVSGVALALFAWLLVSGWLGAWLDSELIEAAAAEEDLDGIRAVGRVPVGRAFAVRVIAHLPTLAVLVVGLFVLLQVTYAELTNPSSGDLPLLLRVVIRAPGASIAVLMAWLVGETWGGIAERRLALGERLLAALGSALNDTFRPSAIATIAATVAVPALVLLVAWPAARNGFDRLWPLVVDGADPAATQVALVLFVAVWLAGAGLLAVALAWRSAAWTAESLRRG